MNQNRSDEAAHAVTTEKESNLHLGQPVYVKDSVEAWTEATVFDLEGNCVLTKDAKGKIRKQTAEEVCLRGESDLSRVEDLTRLTPLNEATVLMCLSQRFRKGVYYTRAGCTIVAVNPFQEVAHLYTLQEMQKYRARFEALPPHIYQIADEAYWRLEHEVDAVDQSIVVSGESGAGKTVSAKHMLRYITTVASNETSSVRLNSSSGTAGEVEKRIIDCNPILEAFGNAATPRNENSSRFGKFTDLQFERGGVVHGAAIQVFLLEKTRVPHQGKGECNFHIFYQLAQGVEEVTLLPECFRPLILELAQIKFRILPPSPEMRENRSLFETVEAMVDLGLAPERLLGLLQVIGAILYLGNVDFKVSPKDDDSSLVDPTQDGQCSLDFSYVELTASCEGLRGAARMLGVGEAELEKVLLHRNIQPGGRTRRTIFVKPVSQAEAGSRRDCLAMLLYARLFDWLVDYINQQITAESFEKTIGLLDIYGFEVLKGNSLEQMCINYANERLQQHFTKHILHNLQLEYEEEKIKWQHIAYRDNKASLEVLEGRASIFSILNEQVYLGRAVEVAVLAESLQQLTRSRQGAGGDLTWQPCFTVLHYAGPVVYLTDYLVTKNKDNVPVELVSLLQTSGQPFVQQMFEEFQVQQGQGKKMKTVLSKFKNSLDGLMHTLENRRVHYIRCIKPNPSNKAGLMDRPYCLTQLEACGIIEATHITRDGYAARFDYRDFQQRYGLILHQRCDGDQTVDGDVEGDDNNDESEEMYDALEQQYLQQMDLPSTPKKQGAMKRRLRRRSGLSSFSYARSCSAAILRCALGRGQVNERNIESQFGVSKLFLSQEQLERLEVMRAVQMSHHATVVQMAWLRYKLRGRLRQRWAVNTIGRAWLRYKLKKRLQQQRAVAMIWRAWLLHKLRERLRRRRAVHTIWRAWLRYKLRERLQQRRAVNTIWRSWQNYQCRKTEQRRQEAAASIQTVVRQWLYRKAVRDAGVFDSMDSSSASNTLTNSPILMASTHDLLHTGKDDVDSSEPNEESPRSHSRELGGRPVWVDHSAAGRQHPRPNVPGTPDADELLLNLGVLRRGLSGSDGCLSTDSGVMDPDDLSTSPSTERSIEPPPKRLRLGSPQWTKLGYVFIGDGIVSRRQIRSGMRFHTKPSVLRHGHLPPRSQLSITDCLPQSQR